jgi:hypothetical protein
MNVGIQGKLIASALSAMLSVTNVGIAGTETPEPDPLAEGRGPSVETSVIGAPEAEEEERPALLMRALNGTKPGRALADAAIEIGGLVEGSITYSDSSPPDGIITGRLFDQEHEDPTLNQVLLFFERQTNASNPWDIGFRIELLYGADARFTASNGLFDHDDFDSGPENQFDITQAYVEVVLPIGAGLKTKLGKFITPLGYETVNPAGNAFYSHSFLFNIVPYAHTGVLATYQVDEPLAVSVGFSRGWDQALEDNNDAIDAIVNIAWNADERTEASLSMTVGPEQADNNGRYRTALDLWVTHQASDQLTFAIDAGYVVDASAGQNGHASQVYGRRMTPRGGRNGKDGSSCCRRFVGRWC